MRSDEERTRAFEAHAAQILSTWQCVRLCPGEPKEASGKPVAGMSNSSLRFDLIAVLFLFLFQRRDLTRAKKS